MDDSSLKDSNFILGEQANKNVIFTILSYLLPKLVRPNERDQPNPTQPKFGPWEPDATQPNNPAQIFQYFDKQSHLKISQIDLYFDFGI